ncbi:hypothetical protein NM688_g5562 [Phlebia brevispora]|uniref:Uncharacterized protein n=1 Tax=Phlebia brevispora TaxID=194682 RepID=A0ACC1ST46_9APHY|nr:hypothetical protein NM688_g5562 [Phlebia brevispora]
MPAAQPNIRVIVRLPWNRPEEPLPDPPRVEWNADKEAILWEVIAKSRAVEGAGTDWKGLANHLQVPLPYLLYRAQVRYEEDLRGLQGIREALSPTSPTGGQSGPPSSTPLGRPLNADSLRLGSGHLSASGSARTLTIRTRLNSLGHRSSVNSPQKVSSSSVLTLQGPKRPHTQLRPLTPTSSRASPSSPASSADESEEDEDTRREAEEEQRAEQEALDRKLRELQRKLTKANLGLVSSPPKPAPLRMQDTKGKGKEMDRGRTAPLSASSTSSSIHQRLEMSQAVNRSQTPSHHSLSSASSPQGSIPDIPSPEPRSPQLSPMRHFSPAGKSTSPPAVNHGNAWGALRHIGRARTIGNVRSERGSEIGSETSSFSDLSDASLSASLESALMSNMSNVSNFRAGSRISSRARNYTPRRGTTQ